MDASFVHEEPEKKSVQRQPCVILVSFDLETTGLKVLSADKDQITEIGACGAAVFQEPNGEFSFHDFEKPFAEYVHATKPMSDKVKSITKIKPEDLAKARSLAEVVDSFAEWIDTQCGKYDNCVSRVLTGQNALSFDVPMMVVELESIGYDSFKWFQQRRFEYLVDTLLISKDVVDSVDLPWSADGKPMYKLGYVYKAMTKKELVGAHGALFDCEAVMKLLREMENFRTAFMSDIFREKPKYTFNIMTVVSSVPKTNALATKSAQQPKKKFKTLENFFKPI